MSETLPPELTIPVAVLAERRPGVTIWQEHVWRAIAVLEEVPPVPAADALSKTDVFPFGMDDVKVYRIPGLLVTPKGTLLAYCEELRCALAKQQALGEPVRVLLDKRPGIVTVSIGPAINPVGLSASEVGRIGNKGTGTVTGIGRQKAALRCDLGIAQICTEREVIRWLCIDFYFKTAKSRHPTCPTCPAKQRIRRPISLPTRFPLFSRLGRAQAVRAIVS